MHDDFRAAANRPGCAASRISFKPRISASTLWPVRFHQRRIVAGQIQLNVAAAAAFGEIQMPVRHLG